MRRASRSWSKGPRYLRREQLMNSKAFPKRSCQSNNSWTSTYPLLITTYRPVRFQYSKHSESRICYPYRTLHFSSAQTLPLTIENSCSTKQVRVRLPCVSLSPVISASWVEEFSSWMTPKNWRSGTIRNLRRFKTSLEFHLFTDFIATTRSLTINQFATELLRI